MEQFFLMEERMDLCYPNEAIGWKDGVYYPREERLEKGSRFANDEDGLLKIHSRVWKEIEETGYGIYFYEETTGWRQELPGNNYQVEIVLENPGTVAYEMHVRINHILKADAIMVFPGEEKTIEIAACMTDGECLLTLAVGSVEQLKEDILEGDIYVKDLKFVECAQKEPGIDPTIYLASDSTVQSYEPIFYPQTGWGQVLYQFFEGDEHLERKCENCAYPQSRVYETANVIIENRAIGGRSAKSFLEEGKLDAILEVIRPTDYLFVQFAHNDNTAIRPNRYTPPEEFSYYLQQYVDAVRRRGAICVLVTPVAMRNCGNGNNFSISFAPYREQMIRMSREQNIPLLDLGRDSTEYLNQIGTEESKDLYLWVQPGEYPDGAYADGVSDNAHLNEYGARVYANLLVKRIAGYEKDNSLDELKKYVCPMKEIPKPTRYQPEQGAIRPKDAVTGFSLQEFSIEHGIANFLLAWNSVEDAVGYHVYAKKREELTYQILKTITKEEKEHAITLPFTAPCGEHYHYYITAVFENGSEGGASRVIELDT